MDAEAGFIEIKGRSTIENSLAFYQPIYEWLNNYLLSPASATTINIHFEYFNTSSSRWVFKILKKVEAEAKTLENLQINWHYADEDIQDAGEDFASIINLPISLVKED